MSLNTMAFVRKGSVVRWLGVGPSPETLKALEGRLLDAGNHWVRVTSDRREQCTAIQWEDSDVSGPKTIDSGQPIWSIERQASLFRLATEERATLLKVANTLWSESHGSKEGRGAHNMAKRAQARALFARARELGAGTGRLSLAFFLSGQRTKVLTDKI